MKAKKFPNIFPVRVHELNEGKMKFTDAYKRATPEPHRLTQWTRIRKNCNLEKTHCLPQMLNSMFFENFSNGMVPNGPEE